MAVSPVPPAGGKPDGQPAARYHRPRELATWPNAWRLKWGQRANELEAQGLDWREAERQAFGEVKAAMDPDE